MFTENVHLDSVQQVTTEEVEKLDLVIGESWKMNNLKKHEILTNLKKTQKSLKRLKMSIFNI